jgi:Mg-chelatase subunit ChlD
MKNKSILFITILTGVSLYLVLHSHARTKLPTNYGIENPPPLAIPTDRLEEDSTTIQTQNAPKMQVVFALDCTGSMGGLIKAAKDKIWSIASGMAQTTPTPELSFGFVFYRDRGDAFVTQQVPLVSDLDLAYERLMVMQAAGGGDGPESVNQALWESVTQFQWSTDTQVLKLIFLVGDAPPHLDYQNDVHYREACKKARQKDIFINTIQCGNMRETTPIWKEIAQLGGGEYLQLSQTGSEVVVRSPYDDTIAMLMRDLDRTRIYYGTTTVRVKHEEKLKAAGEINTSANSEVLAKRAEYNIKNKSAYMGSNELVSDIIDNKVKLDTLAIQYLPENMRAMSKEEREAYLKEMVEIRQQTERKLAVVIKQRSEYAENKTNEIGERAINNSFSGSVHNVIVNQAKVKQIKIDAKVKN